MCCHMFYYYLPGCFQELNQYLILFLSQLLLQWPCSLSLPSVFVSVYFWFSSIIILCDSLTSHNTRPVSTVSIHAGSTCHFHLQCAFIYSFLHHMHVHSLVHLPRSHSMSMCPFSFTFLSGHKLTHFPLVFCCCCFILFPTKA